MNSQNHLRVREIMRRGGRYRIEELPGRGANGRSVRRVTRLTPPRMIISQRELAEGEESNG